MTVTYALPSRLPAGFKLRHQFVGFAAGGFPTAGEDQAAIIHTRSWQRADVSFPLAVFVASALGQSLIGTHGRDGTPIDVGVPDTTATYHDGMWYVDGEALPTVGLREARTWRTEHELPDAERRLVPGAEAVAVDPPAGGQSPAARACETHRQRQHRHPRPCGSRRDNQRDTSGELRDDHRGRTDARQRQWKTQLAQGRGESGRTIGLAQRRQRQHAGERELGETGQDSKHHARTPVCRALCGR